MLPVAIRGKVILIAQIVSVCCENVLGQLELLRYIHILVCAVSEREYPDAVIDTSVAGAVLHEKKSSFKISIWVSREQIR
jgi:hypothetical protein